MSDLYASYKTFSNNAFGDIRVLEIENEPWFVGKDVAEALGYSNTRKALIDHIYSLHYLNKLGLYTVEDVIEFDKKLVLKIPKCDERSEVYENSTLDS